MGGYNGFRKFFYVASTGAAQIEPQAGVPLSLSGKLEDAAAESDFFHPRNGELHAN